MAETDSSTCTQPDCGYRIRARGLCRRHYARWLRGADLPATAPSRRPPDVDPATWWRERVCKPEGNAGCWFAPTATNSDGRPHVGVDGRTVLLARLLWVAEHGDVPPGLELAHNCLDKRCVNPEHLRATTHQDNRLDEHRASGGLDRVRQIRFLAQEGLSAAAIARQFGQHPSTVSRTINNQAWRNT